MNTILDHDLGCLRCPRCASSKLDSGEFVLSVICSSVEFSARPYAFVGKNGSQETAVETKLLQVIEPVQTTVRCRSCLYSALVDHFIIKVGSDTIASVQKIGDKWSTLRVDNKTVFVPTDNLPRGVNERDLVELVGVRKNEIEADEKLRGDIAVRRK